MKRRDAIKQLVEAVTHGRGLVLVSRSLPPVHWPAPPGLLHYYQPTFLNFKRRERRCGTKREDGGVIV